MIGLYTGSFNPWHKGHDDIVNKALTICDKVIVLQCINPTKKDITKLVEYNTTKLSVQTYEGLVRDYLKTNKIDVIIRGLRNNTDFEYEKSMQYINEDLGITIPTIYFICDRNLTHISSSVMRQLDFFGAKYDIK